MSAVPISDLPPRKSFAQVAAAAHKPPIIKGPQQSSATIAPQPPRPSNHDLQSPTQSPLPDIQPPYGNGQASSFTNPPLLMHGEVGAAVIEPSEADTSDGGPMRPVSVDGLTKRETSDTKSVASRTTLTIDEKESLRPDDSASVQAAIEDDSPSGSKVGSNPEARAFRDQLHEIDRTGQPRFVAQRPGQPLPLRSLPNSGGAIVYAGSPAPPMQALPPAEIHQTASRPPSGLALPPDDKLLEALASPKDRLFVLKIEQDIIDFVKDSKENFLQLPQTNSFYRMLSHKLADYYCLNHVVDDSMTSVRIYRTPHCRLPPPLIGDPTAEGSTPPPQQQTRKIMRRGDEGTGPNTGDNTRNTSKTGSELGEDKGPLTREEREHRYNEARARIFKDFNENQAKEGEPSLSKESSHSRSSSRSGVKKTKGSKKKPRDDTFEARSAYNQYGHQAYAANGGFPNQEFYQAFGQMSLTGQYPQQNAGQQMPPTDPNAHQPGQMPPAMSQGQWYPQPQQQHQQQQLQQVYGMYNYMGQQSAGFPQPPAPQGFQGYPAAYNTFCNNPSVNSQTTPRPGSAAPATYTGQGYSSPPPGNMWPQQQYPSTFVSQYGYPAPGGGHQGAPVHQQMYGFPPGAQPEGQYYGAPSPNMYGQPHFNPQSQAFFPAMQPGMVASAYTQTPMYGNHAVHYPMRPAMQMSRQPSGASQTGSGYGSPRPLAAQSPGRPPHTPSRGQAGKTQWQSPGGYLLKGQSGAPSHQHQMGAGGKGAGTVAGAGAGANAPAPAAGDA